MQLSNLDPTRSDEAWEKFKGGFHPWRMWDVLWHLTVFFLIFALGFVLLVILFGKPHVACGCGHANALTS